MARVTIAQAIQKTRMTTFNAASPSGSHFASWPGSRSATSCPAFSAIGDAEIASVIINIPVAVLIWFMVIPMLLKIAFGSLRHVGRHWRGIGVTLFINWAVKPFSMAALGWFFVAYLFRPWLPADQINSYIAGLIILAAAPCTGPDT
jgi:ACR3 family arsenite efflux pump ArsB